MKWSLLILGIIVGGVFLSIVKVSPYPAGDDPGYHSSILRFMVLTENTKFPLPYFPQLGMGYDGARFVPKVFLTVFSKMSGIEDVFRLTIGFAAFCLSFSLVFLYLLGRNLLKNQGIALFVVLFLGFSWWYQANFWEGSYDQYAGILFLSALLYCLFRWWKESSRKNFLIIAILLLMILYHTHELGFLIAFLTLITLLCLSIRRISKRLFWLVSLMTVFMIMLGYLIFRLGYFAPNGTGYLFPYLLSEEYGVPKVAYNLIIWGLFVLFFWKRETFLFIALGITFLFSQATIFLGLPFYPFRFNPYFIQILALIFGMGLEGIFNLFRRWLRVFELRIVISFFIMTSIFIPQYNHIQATGRWITRQEDNPASVILKEDIEAFRWIRDHTLATETILAPMKWGYYLPALSDRNVILNDAVGGDHLDNRWHIAQDAMKIYTTDTAELAYSIAKDLRVHYIFWDVSISRFRNRYSAYQEKKLQDTEKFRKVYDRNNVRIYQVL